MSSKGEPLPAPVRPPGRPPGTGLWQDKHCNHRECHNCNRGKIQRCLRNPHLCPVCRVTPGRSLPETPFQPEPPQASTRTRETLGSTGDTPQKDQTKRKKVERPTVSAVTEAAERFKEGLRQASSDQISSLNSKADSLPTSGRAIKVINDSIAQLSGCLGRKVR